MKNSCSCRLSICLLVIATTVLSVMSCGTEGNAPPAESVPPDVTTASASPAVEETAAETEEEYNLEPKDFGGRTITVIAGNAIGQNYPYYEVFAEELNGEPLNDAVYGRNLAINEKYNVNIVARQIQPGGGSFLREIKKAANSGDYMFDIALSHPTDSFTSAVNGYLYPIDDLPYIDISNKWWLNYFNDVAMVNGRRYFLGGDMNIDLFAASGLIYYNQTVQENYGIEDLYSVVDSGKFTVEKFMSLCEAVTGDLDGDGTIGDADIIGFRGNNYSFQMFFLGFGKSVITRSSDNTLELNLSTDVIDRIRTSITILNSPPYVQHPDLEKVGFPSFMEDRALFMTQPAYQLSQMRDMKSNYGMLPMPKYDESQADYFTQIHTTWSSVTAVPITVQESDKEMIGQLIEDMTYYSYKLIRPVYYEVMMEGKYARDEKSTEIMNMIFDNIIVDFAYLMTDYKGFDFDSKTRDMTAKGDTDVVSFISGVEEKYSKAVESINNEWH